MSNLPAKLSSPLSAKIDLPRREAPVSEKRPWSKRPLGRLRTILLVVLGTKALALSADEPLRPPYRYTICSPAETLLDAESGLRGN